MLRPSGGPHSPLSTWNRQGGCVLELSTYFISGLFNDVLGNLARRLVYCVYFYRSADKSLTRPGRKQANASVRMA